MNREEMKREFPPMPLQLRVQIENEVKKQAGALPRRRPARKLGRMLLVAAAIVLALSAAAMAVYQYTIRDTVAAVPDFQNPSNIRTELSLNGFADSPEYQAYVEWVTWDRVWKEENKNWFSEQGVDDSYYETPENYAHLYDAYAAEQGAKLDEIMEKYGLTSHTDMEAFYTESQLCAALGVKDFLGDSFDIRGDYLYEDGAFKAAGTFSADGEEAWISIVNAAKGSITMIASSLPEEYEEWSYTAASGQEVILAAAEDSAWMVADLPGAYVTVFLNAPLEKAEVEALVDEIDLDILAARFDGSVSREESAAMLAAWRQARESAATTDNMDGDAELALAVLGNFYLADTPEGSFLFRTSGYIPEIWEGNGESRFSGRQTYDGGIGIINLSWYSLDGEDTNLEEYLKSSCPIQDYKTVEACTVQGYEGRAIQFNAGDPWQIFWLDTERGLIFEVSSPYEDMAQAIALAESTTQEDPAQDTTAAGRAKRMALYEEEIKAVQASAAAERAAD